MTSEKTAPAADRTTADKDREAEQDESENGVGVTETALSKSGVAMVTLSPNQPEGTDGEGVTVSLGSGRQIDDPPATVSTGEKERENGGKKTLSLTARKMESQGGRETLNGEIAETGRKDRMDWSAAAEVSAVDVSDYLRIEDTRPTMDKEKEHMDRNGEKVRDTNGKGWSEAVWGEQRRTEEKMAEEAPGTRTQAGGISKDSSQDTVSAREEVEARESAAVEMTAGEEEVVLEERVNSAEKVGRREEGQRGKDRGDKDKDWRKEGDGKAGDRVCPGAETLRSTLRPTKPKYFTDTLEDTVGVSRKLLKRTSTPVGKNAEQLATELSGFTVSEALPSNSGRAEPEDRLGRVTTDGCEVDSKPGESRYLECLPCEEMSEYSGRKIVVMVESFEAAGTAPVLAQGVGGAEEQERVDTPTQWSGLDQPSVSRPHVPPETNFPSPAPPDREPADKDTLLPSVSHALSSVVIRPSLPPPSKESVLASAVAHGLPGAVHIGPFYSNPEDVQPPRCVCWGLWVK